MLQQHNCYFTVCADLIQVPLHHLLILSFKRPSHLNYFLPHILAEFQQQVASSQQCHMIKHLFLPTSVIALVVQSSPGSTHFPSLVTLLINELYLIKSFLLKNILMFESLASQNNCAHVPSLMYGTPRYGLSEMKQGNGSIERHCCSSVGRSISPAY